jgi:hypothetical protein
MARLYGKQVGRKELLRKIGNISQVCGVRRVELRDGMEEGVEAVEFRTGTGFSFTTVPDRAVDISHADFCGRSLCWCSSTGVVNPAYYEPEGFGWLRSFFSGLLTTCGLTQMGMPCEDEGEKLGLHGRISNIAASNVYAGGEWQGEDYVMWVQGNVRQTRVFGENVLLTRKISTKLGENKLWIEDIVENEGFEPVPHMILYHINGGYPAVDEGSVLVSPTTKVRPRNDEAKKEQEKYAVFLPPTKGFNERVYFHEMAADSSGYVAAGLINRSLDNGNGFGFYVKYSKKELPYFIEWKMNGEGTYVVGIEPGNALVEGRAKERSEGRLVTLNSGEKRKYSLEIGVLAGRQEIEEFERLWKK